MCAPSLTLPVACRLRPRGVNGKERFLGEPQRAGRSHTLPGALVPARVGAGSCDWAPNGLLSLQAPGGAQRLARQRAAVTALFLRNGTWERHSLQDLAAGLRFLSFSSVLSFIVPKALSPMFSWDQPFVELTQTCLSVLLRQ